MEDDSFSVQVFGPGVQIERNVPEPVVYRILQLLLESGSEVRAERARHSAEDETGRLLRKSFRRYRPRTNAERIALVVASVERLWERPTRRDEIADWLVLAGEALPANFSRDLSLALEKDLIVPDQAAQVERYLLGPAGRARFQRNRSPDADEETSMAVAHAAKLRLLRRSRQHGIRGIAPADPRLRGIPDPHE